MSTASQTLAIPGWYIELQAALLRQAPRPGEIDRTTAEGWIKNQAGLKKNLAKTLIPPLLAPVESGIKFLGHPAFKFGERFIVNTSDGAVVTIAYLGDNLKAWFWGMDIPAVGACELDVSRLTKRSLGQPIMDELGANCETGLGVVFWGMAGGQWSKGRMYLTYALDGNDKRRAAYWRWGDGGWKLYADVVDHPSGWSADYHVVSRKPLAA